MLESFKELFSSTVSTAAQRVKNPVIGAFTLSWCAFNWKSLLYLFLSDTKIYDKIEFISAHSGWTMTFCYPALSAIVICGFLPWANNVVQKWQSKPLMNSDSIENYRQAKKIQRSTRLQRLKAKHDVTYDKVKTGAETEIQGMREQILKSQERMGEITAERDALKDEITKLNMTISTSQASIDDYTQRLKLISSENEYMKENIKYQSGDNLKDKIRAFNNMNTTKNLSNRDS
ncbi:TPA: hypothetical protein R4A59_004252 [Salmonella enterica subsp. enterica serovar Matopeni]|uniref:hypothetical protein n=1 Tax=Citrobacter sp. Cpo071 TaxID=2985133 RepID=UPI0012733E50|nr:hypothetical protein [Citrobacter sp. Cpo071]EAS3170734.1 hypothetical protein [Salmonella enterica]EBF8503657.1 hypothetical protein [Salmonella enterica subsp. enterica serovar Matopeni]EBZ6087931.1 hypothetical protein [Salmonella enterica subsp. enterica serovar Kumasi]EAU0858539.1 hypothetical protein [Salmonella enterica]ECD1131928.1 hypothetical protein [Salmonella enterica subsp. enterica serovar Matopeni]